MRSFSIRNSVIMGLFLVVFCLSGAVFAEDQKNTGIKLQMEFGNKDRTARDYDIAWTPMVVTQSGTMASVKIGDENTPGSFKMEITPSTTPDRPELVVMAVKAWEAREVKDTEGKYVKKFVLIMDEQAMKVKSGSKSITEIRVGADRDILITITPTIQED